MGLPIFFKLKHFVKEYRSLRTTKKNINIIKQVTSMNPLKQLEQEKREIKSLRMLSTGYKPHDKLLKSKTIWEEIELINKLVELFLEKVDLVEKLMISYKPQYLRDILGLNQKINNKLNGFIKNRRFISKQVRFRLNSMLVHHTTQGEC